MVQAGWDGAYTGKDTDMQVQEAQRVQNKINLKRSTPRHIVINIAKIKD